MAHHDTGAGFTTVRGAGLAPARLAATLLAGVGLVVAAASVLLPWVTVPAGAAGPLRPPDTVSWTGLEDPSDLGLLVLAAAAAGLGFLLPTVLPRGRWLALGTMAASLAAGAVGWQAMGAREVPSDLLGGAPATVDVDAALGLQVLFTGVGLAVVGNIAVLLTRRVAMERLHLAPAGTVGAPPGWYADPAGGAALRWWTGTGWTHHVAGTTSARPDPPVMGAVPHSPATSGWAPPEPDHRRDRPDSPPTSSPED